MSRSSSPSPSLILRITIPNRAPQEVYLEPGLTIGRMQSSNVWIDHPDVERLHARVLPGGSEGQYILECQTERAKVQVNSEPHLQSRLPMVAGVEFRIGPAHFQCAQQPARAQAAEVIDWETRCPRCHASLVDVPKTTCECPACAVALFYVDSNIERQRTVASSFRGWLPRRVGPYQVREFVAEGGMGIVLRAFQAELERAAALKLLRTSENLSAQARFNQEIQSLRQCNHYNIVRLQDAGIDRNLIWLAMDWVDGTTLEQEIGNAEDKPRTARPQRLSIERVADYVSQIARGLEYLHSRRMMHRDLKPGNILVGADGLVRIVDFSIAKHTDRNLTQLTTTGSRFGTLNYMAPEQQEGREVTAKADIYALGLVWYEMLTRHRPSIAYEPVAKTRPDCPPHWEQLIARCLQVDPRKRPTASEVFDLVMHAEKPANAAAQPEPARPQPPPAGRGPTEQPVSPSAPAILAGPTTMPWLETSYRIALGSCAVLLAIVSVNGKWNQEPLGYWRNFLTLSCDLSASSLLAVLCWRQRLFNGWCAALAAVVALVGFVCGALFVVNHPEVSGAWLDYHTRPSWRVAQICAHVATAIPLGFLVIRAGRSSRPLKVLCALGGIYLVIEAASVLVLVFDWSRHFQERLHPYWGHSVFLLAIVLLTGDWLFRGRLPSQSGESTF